MEDPIAFILWPTGARGQKDSSKNVLHISFFICCIAIGIPTSIVMPPFPLIKSDQFKRQYTVFVCPKGPKFGNKKYSIQSSSLNCQRNHTRNTNAKKKQLKGKFGLFFNYIFHIWPEITVWFFFCYRFYSLAVDIKHLTRELLFYTILGLLTKNSVL